MCSLPPPTTEAHLGYLQSLACNTEPLTILYFKPH